MIFLLSGCLTESQFRPFRNSLVQLEKEADRVQDKFVKLEKETVHQLLFEAPVSAIEAIKTGEQRKGFLALGKVEVIDLTFDHTAQISGAVLHLHKDDAQTWESLIGRVKSGEIDRARTEDAAAEAVMLDEARAEVPTNCPNCNAPLDQALVRGMTSINCQYCGTVIQI